MELIPILSFIILVATASTFVLAVGAYALYKVRERKGRVGKAAEPAALPAEMVTPTPLPTEAGLATAERTLFEEEPGRVPTFGGRQPSLYSTRHTSTLRPSVVPTQAPTYAETSRFERATTAPATKPKTSTGSKFMRYTSEGYVEPNTEPKKSKNEEDTLRWR